MPVGTAPPYRAQNVMVGDAALYIAPSYTPLPLDSSLLFDPTNWTGQVLTANSATAVTLSVTNNLGVQTTSSITSFGTETAAALATTLAALSNVGAGNVTVVGSAGGPFTITFAYALGVTTVAVTASTGGTGPTVVGGLWVPAGASDAGWTFGTTKQTQDIQIEEQSTPVGTFITSQDVMISGALSEDTMQQLQWSLNALKTITAQATGIPQTTTLTMTDAVQHYAVALESQNPYGLSRRIYIPDTVMTEGISQAYRRAASNRTLAVSFRSVCATSAIIVKEFTLPAL